MDLVGTWPRSQPERARREDRRLKFYGLRAMLACHLDYRCAGRAAQNELGWPRQTSTTIGRSAGGLEGGVP
jgi:hypothetical protein